jgi:hypothetical protein
LVIAPYIAVTGGHHGDKSMMHGQKTECCSEMKSMHHMDMGKCDMEKCMSMTEEECAAYCDSMQCTPEQKEACLEMRKHCSKMKSECSHEGKVGCGEHHESSEAKKDCCQPGHKK